jgi:hypothetical protein
MSPTCVLSFTLFLILPETPALSQQANTQSPEGVEFFEKRIRPVLAEHCFGCHGPKKQKAGLRLDNASFAFKGSDSGPVLVKGHPDKSALIQAVRHAGDVKMPPGKRLADDVIADLTAWVKMGAPWPAGDDKRVTLAQNDNGWKKHWAFQPVRTPQPPAVRDSAWPLTELDRFVLAALERKGLRANPPADRRTLLRRATYDLIGLPPTAAEIADFEADASPAAFAKVVDRLLASPHYGERWGRHWLDVARYADTKGYVFTQERRYAFAYTYRDYVIRAFNEDLPYDQFIVQQLAADRLLARGEADRQTLAAMGYLTLGRRFLNNVHDIIDDRIDVVSRGLLGLTVSCARCHDHKYDPIPSEDYYSLYGVFASSVEPRDLPLLGEPERTPAYLSFEKKLKELQADVKRYEEENREELAKRNRKYRDGLRALQKKVDAWQATSPAAPPRAMVLEDAASPAAAHVFLRGNPANPGPAVPRQFLHVVTRDKRQPFTEGSGRLELARAIASRDNPLTARVLVNRLWLHHFGAGLVRTPSDFGLRSEPPTHAGLLDYLAWRFVEDGWSIKKMHRLIMLSRVYQQTSDDRSDASALDPENRYLWKFNRQRLDLEALRDSLLAASGKLDLKMGGPAVDILQAPFSGRRTLYGFIDRQNLPGLFRMFDFASPDTSSPQRHQTTVPQQALFLLNSPFVLEQARHLLRRPEMTLQASSEDRVRNLYRLVYGRLPDRDEVSLAARFLAGAEAAVSTGLTPWERYAQALLLANEFVFVD